MGPGALPTGTPTWTYQFANDLSIVRGAHQFGVGADYIHNKYDSTSYLAASGNTSFTGQVTGLGLADFLLGRAASFSAGTLPARVQRGGSADAVRSRALQPGSPQQCLPQCGPRTGVPG